MRRGGGAFVEAVGLQHRMHRLALHPFRQGRHDLGLRCLGRLGQRRVARQPHLGQAQHQRLHLQPGEHLRRQGGVFGQQIAHPRRPVDQRTPGPQRVDVAVQRAL